MGSTKITLSENDAIEQWEENYLTLYIFGNGFKREEHWLFKVHLEIKTTHIS